ncbi:YjbH domain-containing protein [Aestuariicoccus sp. MJ-SS9]|uniref:YjbH domain-containing protein n=1 Tax=Aestuariicoccus sp. MJ-SS9 TaxID=3079855 RepID=UPI0029086104|nr:YjbH domain-containing protein [Aestuariicoccus sp. MJ-SS9]MDU8910972.1 YjbH domain-containing protein [Aestuariicoccus sp. MJ-SS9]
MAWRDLPLMVSCRRIRGLGLATCSILAFSAATGQANDGTLPSYNMYGLPGLIDMPSADAAPDATLAATVSNFGDNTRATLSFQITPRLSGSFRYSAVRDFVTSASIDRPYYDRSFDLKYQLLFEGQYRPAVAIGLQDFIGTGLYGGEYIVATKELFPGLRVTGGLGWGRLATSGAFTSTGTRPEEILGEGGVPTYDRWFRGDVAPFGGVSYSLNDRLTFKVEYSSDNYDQERDVGEFDGSSQVNLGVDYHFKNGTQLSFYHLYGEEVGVQLTLSTNPRTKGSPGGIEPAPQPVKRRAAGTAADLGWTVDGKTGPNSKASLAKLLDEDGIKLESLDLQPTSATLRIRNTKFAMPAQAIGRTARILTRTMPPSVEEFVIVPVEKGIPMSAVRMRRSDVENLENAAAVDMLARTSILDAYGRDPGYDKDLYPRFNWSLSPYLAISAFDPDNPVRADLGARLSADYELTPNLVLSGAITKRLIGNLDDVDREPDTELPAVRTDYARYADEGDPAIERLTAAWYARPGKNLYSRLTVGYLEEMYAGASAEVLWKPVDSRLALGAEVNYVRRRDYDQLFGLQSNTTATGTIPELNGHVSAYYDLGRGFHGQLDVGRYLAGDYGATLSLDREFANGWRIGAFATFTDVPFDDFGEGSFDKGIRVRIPLEWGTGEPSRRANTITVRSLTRDGGARLRVSGRLYNQVRDYHQPELAKSWGKFWR